MKLNLWLKNTKGEPSASLTMVAVAFTVVMLWLIFFIFAAALPFTIAPFVASEAMMVLTPLLGLYFGRRFTDKGAPPAEDNEQ